MDKVEEAEKTKIVALTFDDGPNTTTTHQVLDQLEKYHIRASFFLIGDYINEASAKAVIRAHEMGCEIANHSKTHSDMTTLTAESIREEIKWTTEKIEALVGEPPKFFRPPYILVNETMVEAIDLPFICGVAGQDWEAEVGSEERARLILEEVQDGSIILLHDFEKNDATVEALDTIIPSLQKEGYEFVTISEVFTRRKIKPKCHSGIVYSNVMQTQRYDKQE